MMEHNIEGAPHKRRSRARRTTMVRRRRCILTPRTKMKRFMLSILWKSGLGDSLYHIHDVRCIWEVLP
jgi:hypothetical protein